MRKSKKHAIPFREKLIDSIRPFFQGPIWFCVQVQCPWNEWENTPKQDCINDASKGTTKMFFWDFQFEILNFSKYFIILIENVSNQKFGSFWVSFPDSKGPDDSCSTFCNILKYQIWQQQQQNKQINCPRKYQDTVLYSSLSSRMSPVTQLMEVRLLTEKAAVCRLYRDVNPHPPDYGQSLLHSTKIH